MKLGATKKASKAQVHEASERTRAPCWLDEVVAGSSELQSGLAGLGLSQDQCDRLFQEVAGQLRSQRQVRPRSAAALNASVDAARLSSKVGVPLNVVRSVLAMLARQLESAS